MYRSTGTGLLRMARIPLAVDLPQPPDTNTDAHAWKTWLTTVWREPHLAEAVEAASPAFARAVTELVEGTEPQDRAIRRAGESILSYALRARYRATPFGLFAGTAPVDVGKSTTVPRGAAEQITLRPDALWLDAVLEILHANLDVVERLTVVVDPTCSVRDGYAVVPYTPGTTHPDQVRARATAALHDVLDLAGRPVDVATVTEKLHGSYPDVPRPVVLAMLAELIRSRVLHSDLRPPATAADPLGHVLAVLEAIDAQAIESAAAIVTALTETRGLLDRHPGLRLSEQHNVRERAAGRMAQVATIERDALMIDVHTPAPATVPDRVVQDVADALAVMVKVTPHPGGTPAWQEYRKRFFDRYSFGTLVPILDLVDPVTGIGYPVGYRDTPWPRTEPSLTTRDEHLLARVQQVVLDGGTELLLTDEDLKALQVDAPDQVWPSAEVTVALHAASTTAVDEGSYDLVVEGVSSSAGVLTGRFLPLLDDAERDRNVAAYRTIPTLDAGAVRVQVCSPSLRRRVQNVARSVQVVPDLLAVGEQVDGATMFLDDIAVGATASRLYLVHLPTERRIEPFVMNAVEPTTATHPMVRFLTELPRAHAAMLTPFDWGAASNLPFLPRVRVGRVVLAPARWLLTWAELASAAEGADTVEAWRARWRVPATVYAGESDKRLRLDLTQAAHRALLVRRVARDGTVTVHEAPPDDAYGWAGHATQLTLPFTAQQAPAEPPSPLAGPVLARLDDARLPGQSPAVLLRIDADPRRATDVFASGLADLLDRPDLVESWWFTRYNDHRPHLRVRAHLHIPDLFGALAARVSTWVRDVHKAGLVAAVSWHTDRPETGRYGTGQVLTAAEQVFAADSRAALVQDMPERTQAERDALLVASLIDITTNFLADRATGLGFWKSHINRAADHHPDRAVRDLAMGLCAQSDALADLAHGDRLTMAWTARRETLRAYADALTDNGVDPLNVLPALLHMHHVRARGLDPDNEQTAQRCARSIAHSLLARQGART